MFNRVYFQRIILILIVLASVILFASVAFRFETTNIPSLKAPVAKGDTIALTNIQMIPYPNNALINLQSSGLFTSAAELDGKVAAVQIGVGVPLTPNLFGTANAASKDPRYPAAGEEDQFLIKYFVPTDIKSSQGGVIRPGDYVYVIFQDPSAVSASFVLQKIHVVGARTASGNNTDGSSSAAGGGSLLGGGGGGTPKLTIAGYLLAVTPAQALLLAPLNPANIRLAQVDPTAQDLPNVPSGFGVPTVSVETSASPAP